MGWEDKITYIKSSRVKNSDFSGAVLVVSTEYPTIDKNTVNTLINSGQNMMLLKNSGSVMGGTWKTDGCCSQRKYLQVLSNESFFDGYASNLTFETNTSNASYFIASNYPVGWTVIGGNAYNSNGEKTVLYREHTTSGGKGAIFTYYPQNYNNAGWNSFEMLLDWFFDEDIIEGKTVPAGNIAFIIYNNNDDDTSPTLSSAENAVYTQLYNGGYEDKVTFIKSSRLKNSDLTDAAIVISTQYPTIDKNTANTLISSGKKVFMLYNSGAVMGGTWTSDSNSEALKLVVESNTQYLADYAVSSTLSLQSSQSAVYTTVIPVGWTAIGRNNRNTTYKTALYSTNAGGGRATILAYNPYYFTTTGWTLFDKIIDWLE